MVRCLDRQGEPGACHEVSTSCSINRPSSLFIDYISKLKRDRVVKKFVKAQKLGKL
jgi:hypothetical protein